VQLEKYQIALDVINKIGREYPGRARVLSAETGGDLLAQFKHYDKAIEFGYEIDPEFLKLLEPYRE